MPMQDLANKPFLTSIPYREPNPKSGIQSHRAVSWSLQLIISDFSRFFKISHRQSVLLVRYYNGVPAYNLFPPPYTNR